MTNRTPADLIRDETELVAAGARMQLQSLELLLAEMHALATLLPGEPHAEKSDAEIEADFDNMPV